MNTHLLNRVLLIVIQFWAAAFAIVWIGGVLN